ncbi:cytochrome P450 [Lobosporangium transversale]|uniref:Cytochrome P450 n=1 Tax=Lobosporangium transversale TaxID=64571 RepID=A0A1Y2GEY1_9FUNG|nr:cytochrome P450 [Lobosporangium transversale]ORZ08861.1 cytochrome P450 [Lobosporangium transversale]|eukprot:XP_021878644.1 cytochrome P450 [Lobosporangium transversale]
MIGLLSSPANGMPIGAMQAAIPFGLGLASAAYMATRAASAPGFSTDKRIPIASLRPGDSSHDDEYNEDPDAFLERCEKEYGPVFNIYLLNMALTVISGPQAREVFTNESFSGNDVREKHVRMRSYFNSGRKSNFNEITIRTLIREMVNRFIPTYTPKIAAQMNIDIDQEIVHCPAEKEAKLVVKPRLALQKIIANTMAHVLFDPEIAKDRKVIETLISASADLGPAFINGNFRASKWRAFVRWSNCKLLHPLRNHAQTLVEASTPVIRERRRLEALANETGVEWERPDDVLQHMVDDFDKYGFMDLEDLCAHLLIIAGMYVYTATDIVTNMLYYLAAFPQYMDRLFQEQQQVLDTIQAEREQARQERSREGKPIGDDLDPAHDRDLTAAAIKKMIYMDSFVREVFRFRTERLGIMHLALEDVTLSSGIMISKGSTVIINTRPAHQSSENGEDVTEFRPWRFVGKNKAATKVGMDYLPFGIGSRSCPGRFMNIQEAKVFGELMISKYSKIEIPDPSKTKMALYARLGEAIDTNLKLTSRD